MRRVFFIILGSIILAPRLISAPTDSSPQANADNRPSSEHLDSVHQRGSTDFSDMGSWIWETNTYDRQTVRFWKPFEIPAGKTIQRSRGTMYTRCISTGGKSGATRSGDISTNTTSLRC